MKHVMMLKSCMGACKDHGPRVQAKAPPSQTACCKKMLLIDFVQGLSAQAQLQESNGMSSATDSQNLRSD